eukprot:tig00021352_g20703.t1
MSTSEFVLRHPGSCTGMYWRKDPKTGGTFAGPPEWPRNGAILRGIVHETPTGKFLQVSEYKQAGATSFEKTPDGTFMPFDQGGLLLHSTS